MLETRPVQCPYCGEIIDVVLDCSVEEQSYIEDCQVCCHPINFHLTVTDTGEINLTACHENE